MSEFNIGKNFELQVNKNTYVRNQRNKDHFILAKYTGLGYYLIAPLILGVLLGFGLDSYFGSKPFFILFFIIIGFISAMYNMYRLIKEEDKNTNATRKHQS
jgi:F0F1-type ATP synthase assembly protein I